VSGPRLLLNGLLDLTAKFALAAFTVDELCDAIYFSFQPRVVEPLELLLSFHVKIECH